MLPPAGMGGAAVKDSCCSLARGAGQVVAGSHGEGDVGNLICPRSSGVGNLCLFSSGVSGFLGAGAYKALAHEKAGGDGEQYRLPHAATVPFRLSASEW